ncbi:flagellar basal body P-ring protein FlgI [Sphingomonas sanxanigenens]|uniref:Flagellar P-ring protein n=1 Tax=Sphingomonas sanxanigenens DSM 19645 = NX02 TaxID=1123269 RepID=W0AJ19_9SPHN|nr:flagellar basal body P-ring protein FlgI [Sphingomonas sanxanigenens]AHE55655.1 hypothetical protein NX02_19980 [Sphingomonas sanxanigenens DSM 19645 = NX02]
MRMPPFAGAALAALLLIWSGTAAAEQVRIKDLGRFSGWRDNALVGYGIVTGLGGSGDSPRSEVTRQALRNVLGRLGTNVSPEQIQSRNVAAVIVTATLPPAANSGDRIDITISSIGDARSLAGGTLLMTPLLGPDQRPYALAQGPVVAAGYRFESNFNLRQRNQTTTVSIASGATVEAGVQARLLGPDGKIVFLLRDADFTTADRIATGINAALGHGVARVRGADAVSIDGDALGGDVNQIVARIEGLWVEPDSLARVVVNERSGTVVAGGGVRISSVAISQGDIRISVSIDNQASQPYGIAGYAPGVGSLIVTNTRLDVDEGKDAVVRFPNTTVADLVEGLARVKVDTRGMIAILQALKSAGALHADIIVQ